MLKKIDLKKCRWLILVLAVIVALIAAAVRSGFEVPEGAHANAWITAGGRTAASGLAPDGEPFDIYEIRSSAVLSKAIEKSGLAGKVTEEELAANLAVRPASSGSTVDQLRSFESQTTYSPTRSVKPEDYHTSVWQIQLYGRFAEKLSESQLTALLGDVLSSYRELCAAEYAVSYSPDAVKAAASGNGTAVSKADALGVRLSTLKGMAEELAKADPQFANGTKTFASIAESAQRIITTELASAKAAALAQPEGAPGYEALAAECESRIEVLSEELAALNKLASVYNIDNTSYMELQTDLIVVKENSSATYEAIAERTGMVSEELASAKQLLAQCRAALELQSGSADPALAEAALKLAESSTAALEKELSAMIGAYNEKYGPDSYLSFTGVSFTGKVGDTTSFKRLAVTYVLPVFLAVALVLLVIDLLQMLAAAIKKK